jgi:uncharacterized membrane protein YphA (DoxX/SURF4 family)
MQRFVFSKLSIDIGGLIMNHFDSRLNSAWWALRLGLGIGPFLAGLDKFFNILTNWSMYLSPLATAILPVSASVFMRTVGVIEMIVGLAILTRWTRIGSYVASVWLLLIAANLITTGMFYDLAVRDVEIAIGTFALARLSEVRESSTQVHPSAVKTRLQEA